MPMDNLRIDDNDSSSAWLRRRTRFGDSNESFDSMRTIALCKEYLDEWEAARASSTGMRANPKTNHSEIGN